MAAADDTQQTHLDYFTCTLGEAARWNEVHPHPFETVNHLVDEQADELRQRPAVNFPGDCTGEDGRAIKSDFTYRELRTYSTAASARLRRRLQVSTRVGAGTAGLMCSSTPEFILTWLGLMRLGMSVMLLAPQLESKAIKHLCSSCRISTIFADARNYDKAKNLKEGILAINISNVLFNLKVDAAATIPITSTASDFAYFFHTSGTSSGLPKPIPQTHYAAVGVLPRLPGGETHATFSTTPLYHGGIADCLRAWSSGATIHLFPGTQPITANSIRRAVDKANVYLRGSCPVRYFTSVPYILQMLVHEESSDKLASGLNLLQSMDLVGVGGAALPPSVGNELVAKDVKVVSRFGSAECGFLLSSRRDYTTDHDWAYLRAEPSLQPDYYDFEPQVREAGDSGAPLFELVVKYKWPHRGKTNRPDGSFATADLFEKHPTIRHAWRYHSRADAQITLISGKKFDPAPVEGELLTSKVGRQKLSDAMIFGTGREAPGVLLLPRWSGSYGSDEQVVDEIWPTIERMNEEAQSHVKIGRGSIVVLRPRDGEAATLPKSSKGTVLRNQAEEMYAAQIEAVHGREVVHASHEKLDIPDSKVMDELTKLFDDVLGRHVSPDGDLFAQGVDSIACVRLRKRISDQFCADFDHNLPLNIIFDQGSIERLSSYILRCRVAGGMAIPGGAGNEDEHSEEQLMLELVEKYKHAIHSPTGSFDHSKERVVVLTGATGFLGAHVLDLLLRDPTVSKIFCLVRAENAKGATERVCKSLQSRGLEGPDSLHPGSRLVCLSCSLSETRLGLSKADWQQVSGQATVIIHSAWPVNFSLKLQSFESQLAGLRNLLELRDATGGSAARFILISSTAAVSAISLGDRPIPERLSSEPEDASPLGYSRSKWVAENICTSARVRDNFSVPAAGGDSTLSTVSTEEKSPIIIIRVGQLCGSKQSGVWNAAEAYPILLSAAAKLAGGCLPDLADEPLSWLPVDVAGQALLDFAFHVRAAAGAADTTRGPAKLQKTPVYHVANASQDPIWSDMTDWLVEHAKHSHPSTEMKVVSPIAWLKILERSLAEGHEHPARNLLHLWKKSFAAEQQQHEDPHRPVFETRRAEGVSDAMRGVTPLGREDVVRMWEWVQANV